MASCLVGFHANWSFGTCEPASPVTSGELSWQSIGDINKLNSGTFPGTSDVHWASAEARGEQGSVRRAMKVPLLTRHDQRDFGICRSSLLLDAVICLIGAGQVAALGAQRNISWLVVVGSILLLGCMAGADRAKIGRHWGLLTARLLVNVAIGMWAWAYRSGSPLLLPGFQLVRIVFCMDVPLASLS